MSFYSFELGSGGGDEKQEVQPLFYSIKPAHADLSLVQTKDPKAAHNADTAHTKKDPA